jgi:hypothetical protein
VRDFKVEQTVRGMGSRVIFRAFFWNRLLFKLARLRGLVGFMRIMVLWGYLLMVNKIGKMSTYGKGNNRLSRKLMSRLVAIMDLAGDCLGCSQIIIHLRNPLGEICISTFQT